MRVEKDSTDVSVYFKITAGLTVTDFDTQYTRAGAAASAKVDLTELAAADSAHSDNKGKYVDATTSPGLFRLDVPDAAFATGVDYVYVTLLYATGYQETVRVELSNFEADIAELETDLDVVLSTLSSMSASIVTIDGIVDDILVDTAEIGAAGAGLTDLGGMSTGMKAEVNTEADAALTDYDSGNGVAKQDDLNQLSLAIGSPPDLGSGSSLGANNTDMNSNVGAAGAGLTAIPWNSAWDAEVQSEVDDALDAANSEVSSIAAGTASLREMIKTINAIATNKKTEDATTQTLYKDDNSSTLGTRTISDNGTTLTFGEL